MKNIFKILFLSFFFMGIVSCDNEDTELLMLSELGSGEITAPLNGTKIVLNPAEKQTNPALTINWTPSSYGTPTEITYVVEVALTGTGFANPFKAASTTNRHVTWNVSELNNIAVSAGLTPFSEEGMDIRVLSTVGTKGSLLQTTEKITILVTPFTTALPKIAVPGNHQGWDPATAPVLAASAFGKKDYEGYVWLDGGHKFIAPNETGGFFWGNTDWGWDGSTVGVLVEKDEKDLNAPAGYYFIKVDTEKLTYSEKLVSWGIIGSATPTGWDSDTDLIYNSTTKTLSVTINLNPGPFKFRGNDEWGAFDLGTVDKDGYLQNGGDLTFDGPAGTYKVVLDLSNPRKYTYSITPN
jgi:hypothetical protein